MWREKEGGDDGEKRQVDGDKVQGDGRRGLGPSMGGWRSGRCA